MDDDFPAVELSPELFDRLVAAVERGLAARRRLTAPHNCGPTSGSRTGYHRFPGHEDTPRPYVKPGTMWTCACGKVWRATKSGGWVRI